MRAKLRVRVVLPAAVVVAVAVGGVLLSLSAGAASSSGSGSWGTAGSGHGSGGAGATSAAGFLTPTSTRAITYKTNFTRSQLHEGEALFESVCSTCHGTEAEGSDAAPSLLGLGPATVDFWVSTGRMPLANSFQQALEKPPRFDAAQAEAIAAFVGTVLSKPTGGYPTGIPEVHLQSADLAEGNSLFVLNCAACHTITGAGDALADGYYAPSLHPATADQVAEAVRTGPGNMPVFGPGTLSDQQVADIVKYVTSEIQHPSDRGGIGLGGIGPVPEGFIALLIGVGGLMLVAFWLGERA